jgi:hypothetical protein
MSVKLLVLKSGETIISDAKELVSNDKVCGYLVKDAHTISTRKPQLLTEEKIIENGFEMEVVLAPWILLTSDKEIPVPLDWVITIVEPLASVKQMYLEKLGMTSDTETDNEVTTNG